MKLKIAASIFFVGAVCQTVPTFDAPDYDHLVAALAATAVLVWLGHLLFSTDDDPNTCARIAVALLFAALAVGAWMLTTKEHICLFTTLLLLALGFGLLGRSQPYERGLSLFGLIAPAVLLLAPILFWLSLAMFFSHAGVGR